MRQRQEQIALLKANEYCREWLTIFFDPESTHVIMNKISTTQFRITDALSVYVLDQRGFRKNQIKTH